MQGQAALKRRAEVKRNHPVIVGIGGSGHPGSATERAIRAGLEAARRSGAEVHILTGTELLMPLYNPATQQRTAEAKRLVRLLRDCDGVILGSPGYHGSISGVVKNVLDYIEDLRQDETPYLEGKAVGCLVCAQGWQAIGSTLSALRSVVHALRGWPTPLGVGVNTTQPVFDAAGDCIDGGVKAQIEIMSRQVVEFAQMRLAYAASATRRPAAELSGAQA
jgi:FMN reductase